MTGGVADRIAGEFSACAGELSPAGIADVAPERHNMPENAERSQRKISSPCTRRMSERMSERGAGLSDWKNEGAENDKRQGTPDRFASCEAIQGVWIYMVCAALV